MRTCHSYINSLSLMVERPPKPPCWRDFLPETCKSSVVTINSSVKHAITGNASTLRGNAKKSSVRQFTDLSILHVSKSASEPIRQNLLDCSISETSTLKPDDVQSVQSHHTLKPGRLRTLKRSKNKLRRTQSQATINQSDLPGLDDLTVSLAETNPKEFGLRRTSPFDTRTYLDANMKRCEEWLEDVNRAASTVPPMMSDIEFDQGSGDELEIPEETWQDFGSVRTGDTGNPAINQIHSAARLSTKHRHKCKLKQ